MTWEAVQAAGELLAAVGVLISLVYLASQVRQNAERTFGETIQRYATTVNDTRQALWTSRDATRVWQIAITGEEPEDEILRTQVALFWLNG